MPTYAHPESLVSTQWVAEHLDDPNIRIVEVVWGSGGSYGKEAYEANHIPGAVAWNFEKDLQDSVRQDVLDKAELESLMSRSGITSETTIVLYSGLNNLLATYAFWLLKIYKHKDIRLLDGDRQKWLDENRDIYNEAPVIVTTSYQAQPPDWSYRVGRDEVFQAIGNANHLLVDARSADMYNGIDKAGTARGGHLPGAINLAAWRETNSDGSFKAWRVPTVQQDGTFKSVEELRDLCNSLGITSVKEVITYCVRGGLSTHAWYVLTQLMGFTNVREYDRSWAEWGNIIDLPIEQ